MSGMNSIEALKHGRAVLKSAHIGGFELDALVLLTFVIKRRKEWLFSHDYTLTSEEERDYLSVIEKRAGGTPVQYIVNNCEFMGINFYVDENVLIPRNDTEILVEKLIEESGKIKEPEILDLCSGSGCIAISAAYYNEHANVTGIDISAAAVRIGGKNAQTNKVSNRVKFYESDLFEIFEKTVQSKRIFDIIVSNPPYISNDEMEALPGEVRREPETALLGGETGLEFYEKITENAACYLKHGGVLIFETGCKQAEKVVELMNKNGYSDINIYRDLAGLNRVVKGVKGAKNV